MTRTEKDKIKAWVARNGRVRKYHEEVLNRGNIEIVEKSEELTDEEILALIKYNKKQSRKYVQPKKGGRFFMADFETTTQEAMERTGADHTEVWAWAICPIPCNYEQRDVVIGNSLDSFMEWCKKNLHEDDCILPQPDLRWVIYHELAPQPRLQTGEMWLEEQEALPQL